MIISFSTIDEEKDIQICAYFFTHRLKVSAYCLIADTIFGAIERDRPMYLGYCLMIMAKRQAQIIQSLHVALTQFPVMLQHKHDDWDELFWCLNAGGIQHAGERSMQMHPGDMFYFPAGHSHVCTSLPGQTADGIVLYIGTDLFKGDGIGDAGARAALRYLRTQAESHDYRYRVTESSRLGIVECLWRIHAEDAKPERGHDTMLRGLLQQLVALMLRDPLLAGSVQSQSVIPSNHERLTRVLHYVERRFMMPITVEAMAELAGMSRSHFHALFRQETGFTLMEKVLAARVRGARRMLQETDLPVMDIAYSCGFRSLSHFYRVFKKHTGESVRQIRRPLKK